MDACIEKQAGMTEFCRRFGISRSQAVDYCKWKGRRLPSEEEVEWAMRGGSRATKYPWGNEPIAAERANLADSAWQAVWPKAKGPPLVTRLFAAGFTPIREGWLSLSPTGTHLVAVGESALEVAPGADAQWVDAKSGKTIDLGSTYGLVGPRSWIAAASWAPDGSKALLSVASCADASTAPGCAAERRDLIAVDAKRAVFVASGSRASWHQVVLAE